MRVGDELAPSVVSTIKAAQAGSMSAIAIFQQLSTPATEDAGNSDFVLQYIEPQGIMHVDDGTRDQSEFYEWSSGAPDPQATSQEEMYGYEIVQAIRSRTEAVIAVGEGVVYPVLHGLERDGALKSRRKTVNGRSRIYYSVTRAGSHRLADLSEAWTNLAAAIQKMLTGGQHGEAIP